MKELYKALADFQQAIKPIYKGTSGYGYKYADWGQILENINPVMAKYKLGFTQLLDGTNLKTIVFHTETGESIESVAAIPQGVQLKGMNDFQVLGSAITYMRRYALSAALGLVTDEDADAAGEQVKKKEPQPKTREDGHDLEILARAKATINKEMETREYTLPDQKKAFITMVLGKGTIDNLNDADAVMDALENGQ